MLLFILLLAAYLRLVNGAETPGWYTDEGTHIEIAQNLAQGRVQYLALTQSTLLVAKLPLFEGLLALVFRVWGAGMKQLRALTGLLGVLTVALLYAVTRKTTRDARLALLAALMLAIYPQAVLYSRFGFSYNLVAPLVLCVYLGLWRYAGDGAHSRRGLAWASLAVGVGLTAEVWMVALLPLLLLAVLLRHPRDLWWSLLPAACPLLLCGLWLGLRAPQASWFDLGYTLSRMAAPALWDQAARLALNYTILISQDHWTALALAGMFGLRSLRARALSLACFLLPVAFLGRSLALYNLSFYYMIPLFPFIALGMASALKMGVPYVAQALRDLAVVFCARWPDRVVRLVPIAVWGILAAVVMLPFATSLVWTWKQTREGFSTVIDPFVLDPPAARQAADFVNAHVAAAQTIPGDLVIASPALAWMIRSDVADFQMAAAFNGQATPHFPAGVPPDRWAFDPSYGRARFIIVDNLWYNWAVMNVPGVPEILGEMEAWSRVFATGQVTVYCNPARGGCP
ncbi:MAG: glycosyltransferase family 39 protein [Anaerolineae bacterium]|nr:glycosyltransferase family 39 protein [Anaerolineae bacterium]